MKGLDTNILVRFFTQDDSLLSSRSEAILSSLTASDPGWISLTVIAELVWVFEDAYRMKRADVTHILQQLLSKQNIVVEHQAMVRRALYMFSTGKADFADCLIATSAQAAGCETILTFDRIAARDAGMQWAG